MWIHNRLRAAADKKKCTRKQRKGNTRDTDQDGTITASNGESAKEVMLRECQTSSLVQATSPV